MTSVEQHASSRHVSSLSAAIATVLLVLFVVGSAFAETKPLPILPGTYTGFGMDTPAGSGRHLETPESRIIKVTTLEPYGPGSFYEAVTAEGPRTVVFEVGGVIDYRPYKGITIGHPYLTVAGSTAPGKGIAIYGAELVIRADHVLIENVRFRVGDLFNPDAPFFIPGSGKKRKQGEWTQFTERDSLKVNGSDVVLANCSFSWSTDELVNTRGSRLSFYRCLFAEPIASPKHHKGDHPKALIVMCFAPEDGKDVAVVQNAFLNTHGRHPMVSAGVKAYVADNYVESGRMGVEVAHTYPNKRKRGEEDTGGVELTAERVVFENVQTPLRLVTRPAESKGKLYFSDLMVDGTVVPKPWEDKTTFKLNRTGKFGKHEWPLTRDRVDERPVPVPAGYTGMDVREVKDSVLRRVGAFAGDRGPVDRRVLEEIGTKRALPDSVDGTIHPTEKPFLEKAGRLKQIKTTVKGGWAELPEVERKLQLPEDPFTVTESGYTRLEEWLHEHYTAASRERSKK